jgi:hypothetical protein
MDVLVASLNYMYLATVSVRNSSGQGPSEAGQRMRPREHDAF